MRPTKKPFPNESAAEARLIGKSVWSSTFRLPKQRTLKRELRAFFIKFLGGAEWHERLSHAFTLIEILISIAVISILAAIAVPNFLEAQVRSKVAKATNELHVIAAALQAYWIDSRSYPPNLVEMTVRPAMPVPDDQQLPWPNRIELADGRWLCETSSSLTLRLGAAPYVGPRNCPLPYNGVGLIRLTTPMAYVGTFLRDVYFSGYSAGGRPICRRPAVWGPTDHKTPASWDLSEMRPYGYFNFTEIRRDGLAIAEMGRTIPFVLTSPGPDSLSSLTHPAEPPPAIYDPTNGTVSHGDLILAGP